MSVITIIFIQQNSYEESNAKFTIRNKINREISVTKYALRGKEGNKELTNIIKLGEELRKNHFSMKEGKDTKKYIRSQIKVNENAIKLNEKKFDLFFMRDSLNYNKSTEQLKLENDLLNELLNKNIEYENDNNSMKGFNFLKLYFNEVNMIMVLCMILYISSDAYSGEVEKKTYKILYTQPISSKKIFFGKLIGKVLCSMLVIIICIGGWFIYLSITRGMGSLKYPARVFSQGVMKIMTVKDVLVRYLILFIPLCIFANILGIFVSMITKKATSTLTMSLIVSAILYILSMVMGKVGGIIPIKYIDLFSSVSSGEISQGIFKYTFSGENVLVGCIACIVVTVILCVISLNVADKKRFMVE